MEQVFPQAGMQTSQGAKTFTGIELTFGLHTASLLWNTQSHLQTHTWKPKLPEMPCQPLPLLILPI